MLRACLRRPSYRLLLVGYLAFSLLLLQGLRVHFHTFADHESSHGHQHAAELHIGVASTGSGHDDPASELGLAKFTLLKFKQVQADIVAVPDIFIAFPLAYTARAPWRPAHHYPPSPGGDVRTPPLRAPPV